jgi:putative PIN family toxin of toxin-antitoxin system
MPQRPTTGVVIDTNVWISAALSQNGAPAQLVRKAIAQGQVVLTTPIFEELSRRIWLPKFDCYLSLEARNLLLHDINCVAHWVEVDENIATSAYCRDKNDDKFIHAALAAAPAWLVTGDDDLLVLAKTLASRQVKIVTPAEALVTLEILP